MERIEIVIKGYLDRDWSQWLKVIKIDQRPEGTTSVTGIIKDQAELFGILNHLKNLGIQIVKIESLENEIQEDHNEE